MNCAQNEGWPLILSWWGLLVASAGSCGSVAAAGWSSSLAAAAAAVVVLVFGSGWVMVLVPLRLAFRAREGVSPFVLAAVRST